MGSTTSKGYPYPVGTDRVMDGDDAIKALAEAVNGDALFTRATSVGQSIPLGVATQVSWNPASPNGCELTKTSASQWTVTKAGLYVITTSVNVAHFASSTIRANVLLNVGADQARVPFSGENAGASMWSGALVGGEVVWVSVIQAEDATSIAANTGAFLNVSRLGRI
jgi:hypothetical protein